MLLGEDGPFVAEHVSLACWNSAAANILTIPNHEQSDSKQGAGWMQPVSIEGVKSGLLDLPSFLPVCICIYVYLFELHFIYISHIFIRMHLKVSRRRGLTRVPYVSFSITSDFSPPVVLSWEGNSFISSLKHTCLFIIIIFFPPSIRAGEG